MRTREPEYYKPLPKREPEYQYIPSAEEVENTLRNAAIAKFKRFLEGREYYDYGNPTYDYLNAKKLINMTPEVRKQIWDMATQEVCQEQGKTPSKMSERQKMERELGIEVTTQTRAKQIALHYFFQSCQDKGVKLEDLL